MTAQVTWYTLPTHTHAGTASEAIILQKARACVEYTKNSCWRLSTISNSNHIIMCPAVNNTQLTQGKVNPLILNTKHLQATDRFWVLHRKNEQIAKGQSAYMQALY